MRRRMILNSKKNEPPYYGDGSQNQVINAYNDILLYAKNGIENVVTATSYSYCYGNYNADTSLHGDRQGLVFDTFFAPGLSGTYSLNLDVDSSSEKKFVYTLLQYGALTTGISVKDLKFTVDGSSYSLKELVDNGIIEPLVVCSNAWSVLGHIWAQALKLYDNSGQTDVKDFCSTSFTFTLRQGHRLTSVSLWANKARGSSRYEDGLHVSAISADKFEYRLKRPQV